MGSEVHLSEKYVRSHKSFIKMNSNRSPTRRQPVDACTPEKLVNFSFEIVLATMIETALKLSGLTRALVLNDDSNSLLANSNDSGQVESAVPDSSDDDSEEEDNVAQQTYVSK